MTKRILNFRRHGPDRSVGSTEPTRNQLLGRLPPDISSRLASHLEPVHLEQHEVLFRAHEELRVVYFPDSAVVSFVAQLDTGEALEVGLVGRDGLSGTAVFPGIKQMSCDGVVLIPGLAYRMSATVLRRELLRSEALYRAIGLYAQVLLVRSMQMSVCNVFHTVEQRCIRWLLTVGELVGGQDIPLTHDLLATMLGVRRATVTLVVQALCKAELLVQGRGRILVRDIERLKAACCECYEVMATEQRRLLGY